MAIKRTNTIRAPVILLSATNLHGNICSTFWSIRQTTFHSYGLMGRRIQRNITLQPYLNRMRSAKCQVELYNSFFNINKKELNFKLLCFRQVMEKKCARAFACWYHFSSLEIYESNPIKVYNYCIRRLRALPLVPF